MKQVIIRAYGKAELAHLYYGDQVSDSRARKWLKAALEDDAELMRKLNEKGYKNSQRVFSPAQVRVIFDHWRLPAIGT